ncbi:NAD-dependent epimerase/dehydratase family protein, partial [Agromyces sp. NPDC056379]|uniref:NAD-dependent epimerase/dehydratase family protein n=1 Tax=Agromyces sp. NPDC056379 TaxID=3345802 RepID=UPI0035E0EC9F
VAGSDVAYLTVGLPMDSALWEEKFPPMMRNVIDACVEHGTKLVFFDNTYMYPGTPEPQLDGEVPFAPNGRKGRVRAQLARMLLDAMDGGRLDALIARAPEFYGPGKTKSLTNQMVFDRIGAGKRPVVPLSATTKRSLIWTPDASRAMALLGNTPGAFGQTWHLPIDPDRETYAQLVEIASEVAGRTVRASSRPSLTDRASESVSDAASGDERVSRETSHRQAAAPSPSTRPCSTQSRADRLVSA